MAVIVDIDHDDGTLDEYTTTVTDGGQLSVEVGAALASTTEGLQCVIDDTTVIYGQMNLGGDNTSGVARSRFYIDPNGISIDSSDSFFVHNLLNSVGSTVCVVELQFTTGTGYQIKAAIRDDAAAYNYTSAYTITDAEHYVEIHLIRATNSTSNDGSIQLWIDGASQETVSGIDNYDRFVNIRYINLGAPYGIDTNTAGTIYLDELIVNDDGGEIGPVAPSTLTSSVSDGLTLGETSSPAMSDMGVDIGADEAAYQGTGVRILGP